MGKPTRGLNIVFTGNGKGKTTAALGLALRAAGHGLPVKIIQFIKGNWRTGEQQSIARLAPQVELVRTGKGFTWDESSGRKVELALHRQAAAEGLRLAHEALGAGAYRIVVLDEVLNAVREGLLDEDDVLALLRERPADTHLVLTGREASAAVVAAADLVTEMRMVKHPYERGIPAQRGIEF